MSKIPAKKTKEKKRAAEELYPEAFQALKNIDALCGFYKISDAEICEALGKSKDTLCRRRKEPWKLNEDEKKRIANLLHTTVQALYTDMSGKIDEIFNSEV